MIPYEAILVTENGYTVINGYCSSQQGIDVRVPQDSVLGPPFSLLYI